MINYYIELIVMESGLVLFRSRIYKNPEAQIPEEEEEEEVVNQGGGRRVNATSDQNATHVTRRDAVSWRHGRR